MGKPQRNSFGCCKKKRDNKRLQIHIRKKNIENLQESMEKGNRDKTDLEKLLTTRKTKAIRRYKQKKLDVTTGLFRS